MGDTERWVGDQLYDLLGFSDKTTAEFLVGLARKSSSEENLIQKMKSTSAFENFDSNIIRFAEQLYNRVCMVIRRELNVGGRRYKLSFDFI